MQLYEIVVVLTLALLPFVASMPSVSGGKRISGIQERAVDIPESEAVPISEKEDVSRQRREQISPEAELKERDEAKTVYKAESKRVKRNHHDLDDLLDVYSDDDDSYDTFDILTSRGLRCRPTNSPCNSDRDCCNGYCFHGYNYSSCRGNVDY